MRRTHDEAHRWSAHHRSSDCRGIFAGLLLEKTMASVQAQNKSNFSAAAIAGEKNTQDLWGPYEVAPDWPKPITTLPGHEKWTWGAVERFLRRRRTEFSYSSAGKFPP